MLHLLQYKKDSVFVVPFRCLGVKSTILLPLRMFSLQVHRWSFCSLGYSAEKMWQEIMGSFPLGVGRFQATPAAAFRCLQNLHKTDALDATFYWQRLADRNDRCIMDRTLTNALNMPKAIPGNLICNHTRVKFTVVVSNCTNVCTGTSVSTD